MNFLKCFWIPRHQTYLVIVCLLFVVLPIPLIGILIKSISVLLFLFFMVAIIGGGFSIYKERRNQLQIQRELLLKEREVLVEISVQSVASYRLRAINVDFLVLFDQEFSTIKQVSRELKRWKDRNPCLKCEMTPETQAQFFEAVKGGVTRD